MEQIAAIHRAVDRATWNETITGRKVFFTAASRKFVGEGAKRIPLRFNHNYTRETMPRLSYVSIIVNAASSLRSEPRYDTALSARTMYNINTLNILYRYSPDTAIPRVQRFHPTTKDRHTAGQICLLQESTF